MSQTQPEFVSSVGVQNRDRKIDEIIYETRSYNSKYSDVIVKAGLNPVVPDGYVMQDRQVDDATGVITMLCVKSATVDYKPGTLDIPPPPEMPTTGIAVDVQKVKDIMESENYILREATAQPKLGARPTGELDELRRQAKEISILPIYAPTKVATRTFVGGFDGKRDGGDGHDVESQMIATWMIVLIVFALLGGFAVAATLAMNGKINIPERLASVFSKRGVR